MREPPVPHRGGYRQDWLLEVARARCDIREGRRRNIRIRKPVGDPRKAELPQVIRYVELAKASGVPCRRLTGDPVGRRLYSVWPYSTSRLRKSGPSSQDSAVSAESHVVPVVGAHVAFLIRHGSGTRRRGKPHARPG